MFRKQPELLSSIAVQCSAAMLQRRRIVCRTVPLHSEHMEHMARQDDLLNCIELPSVLSVVRLSLRGRTIIFSIHQPRFAIFKLFDRLSLLAAGRTIYHGNAADALTFFKSIGILCCQKPVLNINNNNNNDDDNNKVSYRKEIAPQHSRHTGGVVFLSSCLCWWTGSGGGQSGERSNDVVIDR